MAEPIKIDTSQITQHQLFQADWSEKQLKKIEIELKKLLIAAINLMQREIIPQLPRGATGLLKQSYAGTEVRGRGLDVYGIFGSDSVYAPYVEYGTKRHFPPPRALELWVRRKLGVPAGEMSKVAFVVARGISQRGTKAQKQVGNWVSKNQAKILSGIEKGLDRIFDEMIE